MLFLILLKTLSPKEIFKVTGKLSVFQDNLILPVCFCKQLLLWLPDASLGSGLKTGVSALIKTNSAAFKAFPGKTDLS